MSEFLAPKSKRTLSFGKHSTAFALATGAFIVVSAEPARAQSSDRWDVEFYGGHFGVQNVVNPLDRFPNDDNGVQGGTPVLYGTGQTSASLNYSFSDPDIRNNSASPGENPWNILAATLATATAVSPPGPYSDTNFSGSYSYIFRRTAPSSGTITNGAPGAYFDDFAELFVKGVLVDSINQFTPSLAAADVISELVSAGDILEVRLTNGASLGGFTVSFDFVSSAPIVVANNDAAVAVNGLTGATTASVLVNDTLNGAAVNPAAITLTGTGIASDGVTALGLNSTPASGGITLNADGTLMVAPGTTAGSYVYTYQICDNLNPGNCDTARITVVVSHPSLIDEIRVDLTAILEDDRATTIELQSRQARDFASGALDRLRERSGHQCEAAVNRRLKERPILFDTDKAIIKPESDPILDEIAEILGTCEASTFEIAGHTDSDASDAYNLSLSQRRVDAVLRALDGRGVVTFGFRTRGYGESQPVDTNATEQGKTRNRRVEFVLIEDPDPFDKCEDEAELNRTFNLRADGSRVTADGDLFHQNYNCGTGVWQTFEGSLNYLKTDSGLSQTLLNLSYRRERFTNNDSVLGYFVGVYGSSSDITSRANGEIEGYGFNAGIYGANRMNNGLYVDYYLGGAVGRHDFNLDFVRNIGMIAATGDYTYFAGFAGVALSGEIDRDTYRFVPRAGIDYAYSPSVDVDVIASLNGISQSGLVELASLTSTRLFTEVRDMNDGASLLAFTPILACCDSIGDFDNACSIGAELEFESYDEIANGWLHSFRISGERGDGFSILSVAADVSKQLQVGQVSARADVDQNGYLSLGGQYELRF